MFCTWPIMCILSKVLERHVWNLIEDFLEETGAISDRQWGFKAGRSTVSALLSTTSDWFSLLDAGQSVCAVFFDYQKAFDSVPHYPLLEKLISLDLNLHLVKWIANYLTSRYQRVVVGGETSNAVSVLSGVSQGCFGSSSVFNLY